MSCAEPTKPPSGPRWSYELPSTVICGIRQMAVSQRFVALFPATDAMSIKLDPTTITSAAASHNLLIPLAVRFSSNERDALV